MLNDFDPKTRGALELLPFEANRSCILAAPLRVASDTVVVVELFDKAAPGFTDDDKRLITSAAEVGTDLLRQAIAERQTHQLLFDAVDAALHATAHLSDFAAAPADAAPPPSVMARLEERLGRGRERGRAAGDHAAARGGGAGARGKARAERGGALHQGGG